MGCVESALAYRLVLTTWHPGCWVLDVTERTDVGFLAYGIYTRDDGRATTRYTTYGDTQAALDDALTAIQNQSAVDSVAPMPNEYSQLGMPTPGNATRDLLVEHDGTTHLSEAFTSRGFAYGAPADVYGGRTRWTLLTSNDRDTIRARFDEIRDEEHAEITVESIKSAGQAATADALPLHRLSHRQREVLQLARNRGYYRRPKAVTAKELAADLGITSSTFHEHLHKAEAKLLDLS